MFREVARKKQALTKEESIQILQETKRGILSVLTEEGYPYGSPINHYYDPEDGKIYFHGGKVGHKIDAIRNYDKASFCVMDEGTPAEEGWWLVFKSVVVFGRVEMIEDEETLLAISRKLSYKFIRDDAYIDDEIRRSAKNTMMFALVPEHITGKRVNEK